MKLKYYLRGVGFGMIIATLVLMVAFTVHREQPLTDDEIIARATALGMVKAEELPTSEKLSDSKLTDSKETKQESEAEEISAQKQEPEIVDVQKESDDKTNAKEEKEVVEQVEITIVGGEYSDKVCKKLKKAGLIEDVDDFNKYLSKSGYDNLIQPGNYVIPMGSDYDAIIKIITERKDKKKQ